MKLYTYSDARQQFASVLDAASQEQDKKGSIQYSMIFDMLPLTNKQLVNK